MIRINLLPAARRRKEARKLPRVWGLAAAAAVLLAAGSVAAWAWREADGLKRRVAGREAELERLRREAADVVRLEAGLAPLHRRAEIASRVDRARRGTWARRLDRVAAILDAGAPRVWLTAVRGAQRTGPAGGGPEATFELACEAAHDPDGSAPMGQVTGEFVEALRSAFVAPGGDFTRYDDRYAEQATPRPGTAEGWSEAFTVRLFRDRAAEEAR